MVRIALIGFFLLESVDTFEKNILNFDEYCQRDWKGIDEKKNCTKYHSSHNGSNVLFL